MGPFSTLLTFPPWCRRTCSSVDRGGNTGLGLEYLLFPTLSFESGRNCVKKGILGATWSVLWIVVIRVIGAGARVILNLGSSTVP